MHSLKQSDISTTINETEQEQHHKNITMTTDTETPTKTDEQETDSRPAAAATTSSGGGGGGGDDGEEVDVDLTVGFHLQVQHKQIPLVGYFVASLIFLVASIALKDAFRRYAYAISVGVVGMVLALVGLLLLQFASEINHKYLAGLLLLWAFFGALLLTFGSSPFAVTGNGYFSVWAMVIFGAQHFGISPEDVKKEVSGASSLNLLGIFAIVVIVAAAFQFPNPFEKGNTIYVLTLACLTVLLVAAILSIERGSTKSVDAKIKFGLLALFSIMWIVAASLVTFQGPFIFTGNGYFSSWGAAIMSIYAALSAGQQMKAEG